MWLCVYVFLAPRAPTHWKKGRILGAGAFGVVYQCCDQETGMELAVKQVQLGTMNAEVSKVRKAYFPHFKPFATSSLFISLFNFITAYILILPWATVLFLIIMIFFSVCFHL